MPLTAQNKEMNNNIKRIPRIPGATYISKQYNAKRSKGNRERLKELYVNHYVTNGFTINGKKCNMVELGRYLGISDQEVLNEVGRWTQAIDTETITEGARGGLKMALKFSLQDRLTAEYQSDTMLKAQGGKYKPFISSETTKAIELRLKSTKGFLDVIDKMQVKSPIQIQNNILNQNAQSQSSTAINTEQALLLIEKGKGNLLLSSSEEQKALYEEYGIALTPEVTAAHDDIGAELGNTARKVLEKVKHEDRREHELGIIDDEDNVPE